MCCFLANEPSREGDQLSDKKSIICEMTTHGRGEYPNGLTIRITSSGKCFFCPIIDGNRAPREIAVIRYHNFSSVETDLRA